MNLEPHQRQQLEGLIKDWLQAQGILSEGFVVHVDIEPAPLKKVVLKKYRFNPETARPLKPEEWQALLSFPPLPRHAEKVNLMHERGDDDGLSEEDFPSGGDSIDRRKYAWRSHLDIFVEGLNQWLRIARFKCRCVWTAGGKYAMRTCD